MMLLLLRYRKRRATDFNVLIWTFLKTAQVSITFKAAGSLT
jgi:hypothetical protein